MAAELLEEDFAVGADVWSVTSFTELRREGISLDRTNMLHPDRERELCWVYAGRCDDEPTVNPNEIDAWRWADPASLDEELSSNPDLFSPWFQLEWAEVRSQHWPTIESLT